MFHTSTHVFGFSADFGASPGLLETLPVPTGLFVTEGASGLVVTLGLRSGLGRLAVFADGFALFVGVVGFTVTLGDRAVLFGSVVAVVAAAALGFGVPASVFGFSAVTE